jgi:hypothetical protein
VKNCQRATAHQRSSNPAHLSPTRPAVMAWYKCAECGLLSSQVETTGGVCWTCSPPTRQQREDSIRQQLAKRVQSTVRTGREDFIRQQRAKRVHSTVRSGGEDSSDWLTKAGYTVGRFVPLLLVAAVIAFFVGIANVGDGLQIGGRDGFVYPGGGIALGAAVVGAGGMAVLHYLGSRTWLIGLALIVVGLGIAVGGAQSVEEFCGDPYGWGCS